MDDWTDGQRTDDGTHGQVHCPSGLKTLAGCKRERRRRRRGSSRSHFWWQHMEGHPRLFRSHCPSGLKTQNQ